MGTLYIYASKYGPDILNTVSDALDNTDKVNDNIDILPTALDSISTVCETWLCDWV